MNPNEIELENISKLFEYEKIAREIDTCENSDQLKNIAKSYLKLYFKQQEIIFSLGTNFSI
jgi:hypothetical protein